MNLIKPKKLNIGDKIGFLALSGVVENKENVLRAQKYFEYRGYKVVFSDNIFDKKRYLAGEDNKKVEELHNFFKNPEIIMILCVRGGYGAIRLLDKIDFELIKNNPKIFAGHSDVTAIQSSILTKTGLITFHSPMAYGDFGVEEVSEFTEKSFFDVLTNASGLELVLDENIKVYSKGSASGLFWGGNLATIASMCGTNFIPDEKFIFFAEDLGEDVYKIDKMMTQLFNIDKFRQGIQGIVLGEFLDINSSEYFDELFIEFGEKHNIPIISGLKITHAKDKITVPYGANAELSTENKVLKIESYLIN